MDTKIDVDKLIKEAAEAQPEKRWPFPMFGVECDKGWEKLYGPLFQLCKLLDVSVLQVKEKFGGLRFYVGGCKTEYFEMLTAFIDAMESLSYKTCEQCGIQHNHYRDNDYNTPARVTTSGGWRKTLCEKCRPDESNEPVSDV